VEDKVRKGYWEGDFVIGKDHKGALVTLVDRKTKKTKAAIVPSKEADVVEAAITDLLKNEIAFTVTLDNGKGDGAGDFILQ